jgi:fucose 4-O-acetylase-like acetyltransferase
MNPSSLVPVFISIACLAVHRLIVAKVTSQPLSPAWGVSWYLLGTCFMFGSFLFLMLKFSSSQAVVMGLYLGYNISYIVWGMVKSR